MFGCQISMLINNTIYNTPIYPAANNRQLSARTNFCGNVKADEVQLLLSTGLKKPGNFTTKEYKTLTESEKVRLRTEYDKLAETLPYTDYKGIEAMHDTQQILLKHILTKNTAKGNMK